MAHTMLTRLGQQEYNAGDMVEVQHASEEGVVPGKEAWYRAMIVSKLDPKGKYKIKRINFPAAKTEDVLVSRMRPVLPRTLCSDSLNGTTPMTVTSVEPSYDSSKGSHAAPKAGKHAVPDELVGKLQSCFTSMALADSTPAHVGMRVVAVGSDENARVGHTGTILSIQMPSQLCIKWNHSGAKQTSNCLKLVPEHKCPAGLNTWMKGDDDMVLAEIRSPYRRVGIRTIPRIGNAKEITSVDLANGVVVRVHAEVLAIDSPAPSGSDSVSLVHITNVRHLMDSSRLDKLTSWFKAGGWVDGFIRKEYLQALTPEEQQKYTDKLAAVAAQNSKLNPPTAAGVENNRARASSVSTIACNRVSCKAVGCLGIDSSQPHLRLMRGHACIHDIKNDRWKAENTKGMYKLDSGGAHPCYAVLALSTVKVLAQMPSHIKNILGKAKNFHFTKLRRAPHVRPRAPENLFSTICAVINMDTLAAAEHAKKSLGMDPVALNLAHHSAAGGRFDKKVGSQEEAIFRNSSLFLSLWPYRKRGDNRLKEFDVFVPRAKIPFFPMSEAGCIYSPNVSIIREVGVRSGSTGPFRDPTSWTSCSIVSCAAQDLRPFRDGPFDRVLTKERLRSVLWVAQQMMHKVLIMGAFGCGAFGNDPTVIATIYEELLTTEFRGVFQMVLFSIIKSKDNVSAFGAKFQVVQNINEINAAESKRFWPIDKTE